MISLLPPVVFDEVLPFEEFGGVVKDADAKYKKVRNSWKIIWVQFHGSALTVCKESKLMEAENVKRISRVSREFLLVHVRTPCYYAFFAYTEIQHLPCKRKMVITNSAVSRAVKLGLADFL